MRKSELSNGTPILVIKINHFVKIGDFATALTDHFYRINGSFNPMIKKTEAMEILKNGLFFHGLQGEYDHSFFEASFEESEKRELIYRPAYEWVEKNYPYLKQINNPTP